MSVCVLNIWHRSLCFLKTFRTFVFQGYIKQNPDTKGKAPVGHIISLGVNENQGQNCRTQEGLANGDQGTGRTSRFEIEKFITAGWVQKESAAFFFHLEMRRIHDPRFTSNCFSLTL